MPILPLRGGEGDFTNEVFGDAWDLRDPEDQAELKRFWDDKDPYSDPVLIKETKERFANLTAYGVALGVFEDESEKDEWEAQNSEEEATFRHGKHPWTPQEIVDDFDQHGDQDEDSSYDNDNV